MHQAACANLARTRARAQVVLSPNGQDVITVADDGAAQVWDMNVGDCVMQVGRGAVVVLVPQSVASLPPVMTAHPALMSTLAWCMWA